jgi:hypothetical protein
MKDEIRILAQQFGYEKLDIEIGHSFALGCSFYKTHLEGVILTDYDVGKNQSMRDQHILLVYSIIGSELKQLFVSTSFIDDSLQSTKTFFDFLDRYFIKCPQ